MSPEEAQELETLRAAHAELQARHADVMGEGGSYRTLQVALDAALQKHADDAAAHKAAVDALQAEHAQAVATVTAQHLAALDGLKTDHARQVDALRADIATLRGQHADERKRADEAHAQALDQQAKGHAETLATVQQQHETDARALQAQHAQAVARLKEDVLVPALRDLQARQAADLKAKHDAELAALIGA